MEKLSITSKALHQLGCIGGQTPAKVGMPADFYVENGDREKDRNVDVRTQKFLRRAIGVAVFGFLHSKVRGPKCSILVAALSLAVTTGGLWQVKVAADWYAKHEKDAQAQRLADQATALNKTIADLGPVDHDHCAKHLDDFNGLDTDASKWSQDDKAMGTFRSQCEAAQTIGADNGKPGHYHVRKYDKVAFATINAQTCAAHLAEANAMTKQAGWQTNMDPDVTALRTFTLSCSNEGLLQSAGGNPLADSAVFSARKYSQGDLMFASADKCRAAINDMNAVVSKPGWRNTKSDDERALASFAGMCTVNGFLKATPGPNDTETLSQ